MSWISITVLPALGGHHSSVMASAAARPTYDWSMLRAIPLTGADPHPVIAADTHELFKLAAAQFMPPAPGEAITMLAFGTVIIAGQSAPFGGFASHSRWTGVHWRLPAHRFCGGEVEAKRNLHFAQIHYEHFVANQARSTRQHTETALATVARIGYVHAAHGRADADVVALWRHCAAEGDRREWCAIVRCVGFGLANAHVLVPFWLAADQPPAAETMREVASRGRASFRCDILTPRVVGTVPGHIAMSISANLAASSPTADSSSSEEGNS